MPSRDEKIKTKQRDLEMFWSQEDCEVYILMSEQGLKDYPHHVVLVACNGRSDLRLPRLSRVGLTRQGVPRVSKPPFPTPVRLMPNSTPLAKAIHTFHSGALRNEAIAQTLARPLLIISKLCRTEDVDVDEQQM